MVKSRLDKEYLFKLSYLQCLLYQDKYYSLYQYEKIRKLIDKLIMELERS